MFADAKPGDERIALLRLDGAMFFGAAERIWSTIADDGHPDVDVVITDSGLPEGDRDTLRKSGVSLRVVNSNPAG